MPERIKISIIGTGYVGLVSGVCLAELGHNVTCVDIDPAKVEAINSGSSPIWEPGLGDLLAKHNGTRLRATVDLEGAVWATDVTFIAVGTPFNGYSIDLSQICACSKAIGRVLGEKDAFHLVVIKSTVVPGTTREEVQVLLEQTSRKKAGVDFGIAMNPEFLREGVAIRDFMEPDRIVIGTEDERSRKMMKQIYSAFENVDIIFTNPCTAEMIKYASNSLLATLISFSNEIANLGSAIGGIDASEVMQAVHLDHRISPKLADGTRVSPGVVSYLRAGPGFGGSCFPKDVSALVAHGRSAGYEPRLLAEVVQINGAQPLRVKKLLEKHFPDLRQRTVALLGVSFKPDTDDIRESPSVKLTRALLPSGCRLQVFDPVAQLPADLSEIAGVEVATTFEQALDGAEAIIVMTCWDVFRDLPCRLKNRTPQPLVIDARRMFAPGDFAQYEGIGL